MSNPALSNNTALTRKIIEAIKKDQLEIVIHDLSIPVDNELREILVYTAGSQVSDVAFGTLSAIEPLFKLWDGSLIVDDGPKFTSEERKKIVDAFQARVDSIATIKGNGLLIRLADLAKVNPSEVAKETLREVCSTGDRLSISNRYSTPTRKIRAPIFLKLDTQSAKDAGLQGWSGFYLRDKERAVITNGTFFIVSSVSNYWGKNRAKIEVYMRPARIFLAQFRTGESKRKSFITSQEGDVALKIHNLLSRVITDKEHACASSY